jgi:two-component system, NtrC family, response regulator GlrR
MTFREYMQRCASEYLAALLAKHNGCVKAAAREAGCNRTDFYKVLKRHGIEPPRNGCGRWSDPAVAALQ